MKLLNKILPIIAIVPTACAGFSLTTSCSNYQHSLYFTGTQIRITPVEGVTASLEEITKLYIEQNEKDKYVTMFNDFCYYLIDKNNWIDKEAIFSHSGYIDFNNLKLTWDDSNKCVRANFKYRWNIRLSTSVGTGQVVTTKRIVNVRNLCFYPLFAFSAEEKAMYPEAELIPGWALFYKEDASGETAADKLLDFLKKDKQWSVDCHHTNHVDEEKEETTRVYMNWQNISKEQITDSIGSSLPPLSSLVCFVCPTFYNMTREPESK